MFAVTPTDFDMVLSDFGIPSKVESISELQRYDNSPSKEVRLIVKVKLTSGPPLAVRFRHERDVTLEKVESQSRFADALRKNGVVTPYQYSSADVFARRYRLNGYEVVVTVEQFVENEIKIVDAVTAEKTGKLLAKMHQISEERDLHVSNQVLFDPFSKNDLFDFESFQSLEPDLSEDHRAAFRRILQTYHAYMDILDPLKRQPRYAVQGDISDCNLYQVPSGEMGIFDFNRCGDNNLFCDAVMQAVFEARLMDYSDDARDTIRPEILDAFLRGYGSVRNFSKEQKDWYPYLYAIIDALWSSDIRWNEDSLANAVKNEEMPSVQKWLETIWRRLIRLEQRLPDCGSS